MTERKLSAADAALCERIVELSVHIPCGGLRGPVHGRRQSCGCEDSPERGEGCDVSREKNCAVICFRATAGGTSRWSGGLRGLPSGQRIDREPGVELWRSPIGLGRHSLMSRIGVGGGARPEVQQEQIARLAVFAKRTTGYANGAIGSTRDPPARSTCSPTSH